MSTRELYNRWSATYDEVENKTRDLEKQAAQTVLGFLQTDHIIELGCGTGKNTTWLVDKCTALTAVDLSEQMMQQARQKISQQKVQFVLADITQHWHFVQQQAGLITCSLILEHIQQLEIVFEQAARHLTSGGYFYICELHPYKQYSGSKARFESAEGTKVLECYVHHISDYLQAAANQQLTLVALQEWFDDGDRATTPRLVSFLFKKME